MKPGKSGAGSTLVLVFWSRQNNHVRILIDYRPALRHRTGVGLWVEKLIEALATYRIEKGLSIQVFSSSWKDRLSNTLPPEVRAFDRKVPVKLLNWFWHHREWPSIETLTQESFDIVHSPSPLLIPSRHAATLVTIHDIDFLRNPKHGNREIRRDYPTLARSHAQRADGVIVPSSYTKNEVSHALTISPDKITVCPNGAPSWSARPLPRQGRHILFVGTISPRKNIDRLLTAYATLRQQLDNPPPLVLAGQATSEAAITLKRLSATPLAGHVHLTGYVSEDSLLDLYNEAILVVLPSLDEGFGIPALEAMTLGIPLVAAHTGALPEVVGDAGLLVDPLAPATITNALKRLVTDSSLRDHLSLAGLTRASLFSWDRSAKCLVQAYEQAIASHRAKKSE